MRPLGEKIRERESGEGGKGNLWELAKGSCTVNGSKESSTVAAFHP